MKKAKMRKINDFDMGTTMGRQLQMCVLACVGGQGRRGGSAEQECKNTRTTPHVPDNGSPVCLTSVAVRALPALSLPLTLSRRLSLSHTLFGRVEKSTIAALRKLTENQRSRRKKGPRQFEMRHAKDTKDTKDA